MSTSSDLTAYAAAVTWEDIPPAVQERARQTFVDVVSVMFAGTRTPAARVAARFARAGVGDVPLAAGGRAAAPQAALANGVAASALDFEDGHYLGGGIHPSSVVTAALLSTATPHTTVRDLLVAQVAGYEVGLRLASLLWPRSREDWYHTTGTAGSAAAAVACARLRGLDGDGVRRSLVTAWQHAPMSTFALPMAKESIGWGALVGTSAAALAADGFLVGPDGRDFADIPGFPSNPLDRDEVTEDPFVRTIGEVFESGNNYFKKYAACRYVHAAAHGFQMILADHNLQGADLASVWVGTHRGATFLDEKLPSTLEHAQYSFPHVLAAVAQHGRAGAEEISEHGLLDRDRRRLAALVEVRHDAELDGHLPEHYGARLIVETVDGRRFGGLFLDAPGDAALPLSEAELTDKWTRCLSLVLPEAATGAVLSAAPDQLLVDVLGPAFRAMSDSLPSSLGEA